MSSHSSIESSSTPLMNTSTSGCVPTAHPVGGTSAVFAAPAVLAAMVFMILCKFNKCHTGAVRSDVHVLVCV